MVIDEVLVCVVVCCCVLLFYGCFRKSGEKQITMTYLHHLMVPLLYVRMS